MPAPHHNADSSELRHMNGATSPCTQPRYHAPMSPQPRYHGPMSLSSPRIKGILEHVEFQHERMVYVVRNELERHLKDLRRQFELDLPVETDSCVLDGTQIPLTPRVWSPELTPRVASPEQSGHDMPTQQVSRPIDDAHHYEHGQPIARGNSASEPCQPEVVLPTPSSPSGPNASSSLSLHSAAGKVKSPKNWKSAVTVDLSSDLAAGMRRALVMARLNSSNQSSRSLSFVTSWWGDMMVRARTEDDSNDHRGCVKFVRRFVPSQAFDGACATVILLNALSLGVQTDQAARNVKTRDPNDPAAFFVYTDRTFTVWFLSELILRMISQGFARYFLGRDWSWNLFDLLVVLTDVAETLATYVSGDSSVFQNLTAIRMLRVLRVIRTVRVIRLVRFFKELRMMVYSVLKSGLLLVWSMMLLCIIIFIFSVYLTQNATFYVFEHKDSKESGQAVDNLQYNFGNLFYAGFVLFQAMTSGNSWGQLALDLMEIHWSNGLVICFYIFFTVLAVLNIITGVFVDTAIKSAQADRSEVIQEAVHKEDEAIKDVKAFFELTDLDKNGSLTLDELRVQLERQVMRKHLATLGVEVSDAISIFRLLDIDKSGEITMEEFVFGCMQMKGSARSVDMVSLIHEHKRLKTQVEKFFEYLQVNMKQQLHSQQRLEQMMAHLVK